MICLNSRRFVYVFKNRMHDSKTLKCSNSSQKVQILLKKLEEIRNRSSYREKFIQGTDKFVRPNKMFEFPSIRVIASQLHDAYNICSDIAAPVVNLCSYLTFSTRPYFFTWLPLASMPCCHACK